MDLIAALLDFVLHVDQHLALFVQQYGIWVYALLFAIVFVETGVVLMPFLPGDSLLFVAGAMCGVGLMDCAVLVPLLIAAAVLGNQSNYAIGRAIGPRVFQWEDARWFNRRAFEQAHASWDEGVVRLVAALQSLGESTQFSSNTYTAANDTNAANLGKVAALGIKVTRHCAYHGAALNVAMDLEPFDRINPCGYAGLKTVDLAHCGVRADWTEVAQCWADHLVRKLSAH